MLLMYTQFLFSFSVYSTFFFVSTVCHCVLFGTVCVFLVGCGARGRARVTDLETGTFGGGVLRVCEGVLVALPTISVVVVI